MSTKKGAAKSKPLPPVAQVLIDNMEIIYWAQIEMLAHSMLIQATARRIRSEVDHGH